MSLSLNSIPIHMLEKAQINLGGATHNSNGRGINNYGMMPLYELML